MFRYQKQLNRGIWLLNAGLLVGLGCFGKQLLLPDRQSPIIHAQGTQSVAKVPNIATEDKNDAHLDLIIESGLFGGDEDASLSDKASLMLEAEEKPALPKEFPLNLRLLGTVAGSVTTSFAVLEDLDARQQDVFKVGDLVQKARVEKILQNRIVVAYEGELWPLDVSEAEGANAAKMGQVVSDAHPVQEGHVKDILMAMSDSEILVNTIASDNSVRALSRATKGLSFSSGGGKDGIKLTGVSRSPVGRLIGLKDGDLIRSVNGHAVHNKRKAAQVLRKARKLEQARFGIVRDQQAKTLSFKPGLW